MYVSDCVCVCSVFVTSVFGMYPYIMYRIYILLQVEYDLYVYIYSIFHMVYYVNIFKWNMMHYVRILVLNCFCFYNVMLIYSIMLC